MCSVGCVRHSRFMLFRPSLLYCHDDATGCSVNTKRDCETCLGEVLDQNNALSVKQLPGLQACSTTNSNNNKLLVISNSYNADIVTPASFVPDSDVGGPVLSVGLPVQCVYSVHSTSAVALPLDSLAFGASRRTVARPSAGQSVARSPWPHCIVATLSTASPKSLLSGSVASVVGADNH